jgi:hypothetical protein
MRLIMKTSDIKKNNYVVFIIFIILIALLKWIISTLPSSEIVYFTLQDTFTCEKRGESRNRINVFVVDDTINICTQVNSDIEDIHKQVQIRIYEGEQNILESPIYYESVWVSNGEMIISLDIYLSPGVYEIQITNGRTILSILKIKITQVAP